MLHASGRHFLGLLHLALLENFPERCIHAAHTAASKAPMWRLSDIMGVLPAMLPTAHHQSTWHRNVAALHCTCRGAGSVTSRWRLC